MDKEKSFCMVLEWNKKWVCSGGVTTCYVDWGEALKFSSTVFYPENENYTAWIFNIEVTLYYVCVSGWVKLEQRVHKCINK